MPEKSRRSAFLESGSKSPDIAIWNPSCELVAGVAAHVLLDAPESLHKNADVIVAVDVLPDVLYDLGDGQRIGTRLLDLKIRDIPEIAEERAVEAVENDKLRLVDLIAPSRSAPEHLLPEDARFYRTEEYDELERRDVYAGGKHIDADDNLGIGPIAKFPDALEGTIHVRIAGNFFHKIVSLREDLAANAHKLIGVRGVRQIIDGKNESLRKAPSLLLVSIGVRCEFLDDLPIAIRRSDVALDGRGIERTLVFHLVKCLDAGLCVHSSDLLALLEEHAVHLHAGRDDNGIVIHKPAIADRLLDSVTEYRFAKESDRMRGWRGGQAQANRIEMVKRITPDTRLVNGVTAVAFVCDDEIKGMNGNVELIGIVFVLGIAVRLREATFRTEKVPCHPLDRGDVDECMAGFRRGEVFVWQEFWVKRIVIAEILALKSLGIDLVFLSEFVSGGSVKSIELTNRLGRERLAIH